MKKTYINPVSTVEHVQMSPIMAVSDPKVTLDTGNTVDNPADFDAKGDNAWDIWGTDDEEEY